jgi:hypothetical protein
VHLEEAIQLDILRNLPAWPHLTARHGVSGVCQMWRTLVREAAHELLGRVTVCEVPCDSGAFSADDSKDGTTKRRDNVPTWALGFTGADLRHLYPSTITSLTLHDVVGISFTEALCFSGQCNQLETLSLARLGDGTPNSELFGRDLEVPLQACPKLRHLRIEGATGHDLHMWLSDETSTLSCIGRLTSLSLLDCETCFCGGSEGACDEDGAGGTQGASGTVGIEEGREFSNDVLVGRVAQDIPHLELLDLTGTGFPTNHACRLIESLLPCLHTLNLSGNHSHGGGSITDRGLAAVAAGCPTLRCFSLRQAVKVSEEGLQALLRGCFGLEVLLLSGCAHIGSMNLVSASPLSLHTLELSETYTTDTTITSLMLAAPRLQSIDLCGCADLTDEVLISAVVHCSAITTLRLAHCFVTNRGLTALAITNRLLPLLHHEPRAYCPCPARQAPLRACPRSCSIGRSARAAHRWPQLGAARRSRLGALARDPSASLCRPVSRALSWGIALPLRYPQSPRSRGC